VIVVRVASLSLSLSVSLCLIHVSSHSSVSHVYATYGPRACASSRVSPEARDRRISAGLSSPDLQGLREKLFISAGHPLRHPFLPHRGIRGSSARARAGRAVKKINERLTNPAAAGRRNARNRAGRCGPRRGDEETAGRRALITICECDRANQHP